MDADSHNEPDAVTLQVRKGHLHLGGAPTLAETASPSATSPPGEPASLPEIAVDVATVPIRRGSPAPPAAEVPGPPEVPPDSVMDAVRPGHATPLPMRRAALTRSRSSPVEPGAEDLPEALQLLSVERLKQLRVEEPPARVRPAPDTMPEIVVPPPTEPTVQFSEPEARTEPLETKPPCPRCGGRLIDTASLGLCPACGYCRSLEESAARPRHLLLRCWAGVRRVEAVLFLTWVPAWFWVLLFGLGGVTLVSVFAHHWLPDDAWQRTLWFCIQLSVGGLAVFAAQLGVLLVVAPHEEGIHPKHLFIVLPRFWAYIWRLLPETAWPIWLICWGATLIGFAVFLIRGLG